MNPVTEQLLEETDWSSFDVAAGPAVDLAEALRRLLSSANFDEASMAWNEIEETVFSQGTIYSSAEPTVSVILSALLEDQPSWREGRIWDLLLFIVSGVSTVDASLQRRCRGRALEGLWLLIRWAIEHDGWTRFYAVEVIDVISPESAELVRSAFSTE